MLRLALLVALLALPHAAAQQGQMCVVESQWGTYSYPCGSGETPVAETTEEEPWWASAAAQQGLAIVGLVGSAGAGAYTVYRIRTKRRTLTVTLTAIERAYAAAKSDPERGIAPLAQLRADLREQHARGRLDDAHFLELDKRATQYLVKLRLLEIDRRFATLPALLLHEVRRLLADGVLTAAEADMIEVRAAAYRIPDDKRAELAELARAWAHDDAPREPDEAPLAA